MEMGGIVMDGVRRRRSEEGGFTQTDERATRKME